MFVGLLALLKGGVDKKIGQSFSSCVEIGRPSMISCRGNSKLPPGMEPWRSSRLNAGAKSPRITGRWSDMLCQNPL